MAARTARAHLVRVPPQHFTQWMVLHAGGPLAQVDQGACGDQHLPPAQSTRIMNCNGWSSTLVGRSRRWTKVLVVTNTFHQLRARLLFQNVQERLGLGCQVRLVW